MQLTTSQIAKAMNLLNIQRYGNNNGNWIGIICPMHSESTPGGSCSINLESGVIHCFSCHQSINAIDLIKQRYNVNFSEALKLIDVRSDVKINYRPVKKEKKRVETKVEHDFTEISFNPDNYHYTRTRGFTEEFCERFNITRCLSGIYNDYMIIPCFDSNKKIFEFEARKLFSYENLNMFFDTINEDFGKLKRKLERYIKRNKIKLVDYILFQDNKVIYDDRLKYLLQPKVKYVPGSQLYRTIWNVDNLKYDDELYVCEGLGSICKLWTNITKNCSAVFGSKIDKEQIEILKRFKKIVLLPDYDEAGYSMVKFLNMYLNNFTVKKIKLEDTDKDYINEIKQTKELKPSEYLTRGFFNRF